MSYHFTDSSVLSFTPTPCGVVHFSADDYGERWALPLIGWAVVVTWASYEEVAGDTGKWEMEHETRVQPVVLDDEGQPEAVEVYLGLRREAPLPSWRVDPAAPWSSLTPAETPST